MNYLTRYSTDDFREAIIYQVKTGGKRLRPIIALKFAEACGGEYEGALPAAAIVELIHNYSLIYDDIIDEANLRRGLPTVRARYGDHAALLIGIWYREAIEEAILDTRDPVRFARETARVIREIDEGERLDILLEVGDRSDPYFVSNKLGLRLAEDWERLFSTYLKMISLKTASLFRASAYMGALSVTDDEDCLSIANTVGSNLGMAFQIIDDVLDIFGEEGRFGKEIGKDIKEHKLGNAVVIMALRDLGRDKGEQLLRILMRGGEPRDAVDIIESTSARDEAMKLAHRYAQEAVNALGRLGYGEAVEELRELVRFTVMRDY